MASPKTSAAAGGPPSTSSPSGAPPSMKGKPAKKRVKKNVATGIAHIQSTFNNTVVTITDVNGNTVAWSSAAACKTSNFRHPKDFRGRPLELIEPAPAPYFEIDAARCRARGALSGAGPGVGRLGACSGRGSITGGTAMAASC